VTDGVSFTYRAASADGRIVRGSVVAATQGAAAESLARRGLWMLELRVQDAASLNGRRRRVPVAQLALGLRILADLLEAGLPLTRTLATFEELAPPAWRGALPGIRDAVRQGKTLGASLGDAAVDVPRDIVGIVQAGEAGSGLARAVRRAAELTEDAASARAALRGALAYPAILAVAGTIAVGVIAGVVLPRFAGILGDSGQTLPATTRAVLRAAALTRVAAIPVLVLAALGLVVWRYVIETPSGRRAWHAALLRLPLLGSVRRSAAAARSCATLAALLESGVPIASALPHAARAAGDGALTAALLGARDDIVHGDRLSRALARHAAATTTVERLVRAGEETGRLAPMLAHAARIEREQAVNKTKAIVRLLEPSLILAFGGLVALVAAALLQALYSMKPAA
jgi:general secretion pathway protein F